MPNRKSGSRTLLLSVLMSAPGPLVVGLGLLAGRSSTQIADFVRRSAELLAIIMAFAVYRMTTREGGLHGRTPDQAGAPVQCVCGCHDVSGRYVYGSSGFSLGYRR